jgi:hypothetical protein
VPRDVEKDEPIIINGWVTVVVMGSRTNAITDSSS